MKAKSAKAKGIRLEARLAQKLRSMGIDKNAKRMPGSGAFKEFKSDIFSLLPISWECKNQETWKPLEYFKQAVKDARPMYTPVVVMSKNNEEDFVFLKLDDFLHFLALANETGELAPELPFSKRKQVGR